tara:strand:+ start:2141 stop:2509 length:369 start_codon:yes stop_codon:yes gene_type:complete
MNIYTKNQSKDKIVSIPGYSIGTVTCFNESNDKSVNIQLTSLESMWYNHEEMIDHPEGSEYPTGINEPFRKLMLERIANSVLSRTGYDIRDYERVIHATCSPGRDKNGNIIDHAGSNLVRNV